MFQRPLEPVCGRTTENFGPRGGRTTKCYKQSSADHSGWILGDQNVDGNVDSKYCSQVSEANRTLSGTEPEAPYILGKNVHVFCLCPETFSKD